MTGSLRAPQAATVVVLLTCLAYLNSFGGVFVFDDIPEIAANPSLDSLWPPWEAMFHGQKAPARPLPYLSFAIDRAVWGGLLFGYHLTNLVVHLVAALALFDLTRLTLLSPRLRDRWGSRAVTLALVIAGLWAVHPLQTQAVTYVYQRIESMVGMFCLLSLASFARAMAADWSRTWLAASFAACAAAMGCKESAVVLPLLLLAYDWIFTPAENAAAWRADVRRRLGFHAACFLTWLILAAVVISQAGDYPEFGNAKQSPITYALTQPGVILHYVRLAVLPVGQCFEHSGWPAVERFEISQLPAYLAIATLTVLVASGVGLRRPWAWLGVLFLGALAPTSSVMPVNVFANEHRMYLPLAAVVAAVVLGACELSGWLVRRLSVSADAVGRAGMIAAVVAALLLVGLTRARNRLYFSKAAIWNDVLEHDPGNFRALWQFARMMDDEGDEAAAFSLADRALESKPNCDVYGSLAAGRLVRGDYAGAERRCRLGLDRQRKALPADDRTVLGTIGDLATALRLQAKIADAEELCVASIDAMRRVLGENDGITLTAEQIIAEGLANRGDHDAAEALARGTRARARRATGPTSPFAINAAVALARVLDAGGKTLEAEQLMKQARDEVITKGSRRPNDRLVLEDMLAEFLEKGGKFDQAVAVRRRVADENERLHGPESPLTAAALTRHALAVAGQATARGDHARAASIYGTIAENYKAALGADDATTVDMEAKRQAAAERARGENAQKIAP